MLRRRRAIVWLGIATVLLLGVGAQLHGLSHSLLAVQESEKQEPWVAQSQPCEQCLLFAALDGAVPAPAKAPVPAACAAGERATPELAVRAVAFTAYVSRAPPVRA